MNNHDILYEINYKIMQNATIKLVKHKNKYHILFNDKIINISKHNMDMILNREKHIERDIMIYDYLGLMQQKQVLIELINKTNLKY